MPVSNASFLDLACTAAELADGWTDGDNEPAASTAETNHPAADPKATVWTHDTNASAAGNDYTLRDKDVGSLDGVGASIIISLSLYCELIGTLANDDYLQFNIRRSDHVFVLKFCSEGLRITDSGWVDQLVGTNLVIQDTWQEWTFKITFTGAGNAKCDVYVEDVEKATEVDCGAATAGTDGQIHIYQWGYTNDDQIIHIDWLKIGDGFSVVEFIPKIMMP